MSNTAADNWIVAGVLGNGGLMEWIHHVEELINLTALLTLGQHHAIGHSAVGFRLIQLEFVVTVGGIHQLLIELQVCGAITDPEAEITAGALDMVNTRLELYLEVLQFEEVLIVLLQWDHMSKFIVFGSNEDLDNSSLCLVCSDVQGEFEGFVVETLLAGLDDKAGAIVEGVATKVIESIGGWLHNRFHIHGIGDVRIEELEVGGQALGHVDGIDLDTLESVVDLGVLGEGFHQMPVVSEQVLVDLEEQRIANGGIVVHEGAGICLMVLAKWTALVHNVAIPLVQAAIELLINAVHIALQNVAQLIDDLDIVLAVLMDPVHHALRVDFHSLDVLNVVLVVEAVLIVAAGIGNAIVATESAVEAGIDRFVDVEGGNLTQVVGQTLQVVTSQELPVHIQIELTTAILVEAMLLITLGPEWIVEIEVIVEAVEANILQEIGQTMFVVHVTVEVGVVGLHNHVVDVVHLLDIMETVHFVVLGSLQGLAIEEVPWIDLVLGGQNNSLHIVTEQAGNGEGIDKELFVHMLAGPEGGMLEGLPVLGEVKQTDKSNDILLMAFVHHGPHLIIMEGMMLPELEEVFQLLNMVIVGDMFPGFVFIEGCIELGSVHIGLMDVLQ